MMRLTLAAVCVAVLSAAPASAALPFSDNFESGVSGGVWTPWDPAAPVGINNLLTGDTSHNHTPAGSQAARAWESDPAAWNGYADFGATAVPSGQSLRSDVYLFEDFSHDGTNPAQPVTNMLALFGDSGSGPGAFTDYLQLGVVSFFPGGSQRYGFRTAYGDAHGGIVDTGVSRKAGWTKLSIVADAIANGGAVRFYIDDVLKGSSFRSGVDLRWVRLGNNSKSYENFWYDDVSVRLVPEPASVLLLGMSGLALVGYVARRRRS